MNNGKANPPKGIGLRRRVRTLTIGVVGAAVLATAGVTATMAYGQGAQDSATAASSAGTSTDSAALAAPTQTPASTTSRTGHASSGGS